jgi:8-oxo-dGTP pyrophosphatase MutT (NUDIX family)
MKQRFAVCCAVYLMLFRDGMVLLSRRHQTGWEDGKYSMIAGHVENGESILDAMIREAKEEAGIDVAKNDLRMVHVMHRRLPAPPDFLDLFFTADQWQGEPANMEQDKCDDLRWFRLDALPDNTLPYIRGAIEHHLNGDACSDWGWQ